jgi:hypothetical protein
MYSPCRSGAVLSICGAPRSSWRITRSRTTRSGSNLVRSIRLRYGQAQQYLFCLAISDQTNCPTSRHPTALTDTHTPVSISPRGHRCQDARRRPSAPPSALMRVGGLFRRTAGRRACSMPAVDFPSPSDGGESGVRRFIFRRVGTGRAPTAWRNTISTVQALFKGWSSPLAASEEPQRRQNISQSVVQLYP